MRIRFPDREVSFQTALTIAMLLCLRATTLAQEYGFDVWTTANGLPQNTVTGVVQTPDGYLWLSTFDGLARFDGLRFMIFDKGNTKGIVNNRFARLFAGRDGVIYAVTEDYVVTVYRNGSFVSYTPFATTGEAIGGITSDSQGNTLFKTDKGYYLLKGDKFVLTPEKKEANVKETYWSRSGAKWVIERNQTIRQKDGQVTTYPLTLTAEELSTGINLVAYEDTRGALWLRRRTPALELWRLEGGKASVFTKKEIPALNELYPDHAWEDANGRIFFLFSGINLPKPNQLVYFDGDHVTSYQFKEAVGASSSLLDREGNFWLATSSGLRRLRRKLITTLSVKDGLNNNEIYPLLQTTSGVILIGSVQGLNHYVDGKITNVGLTYSTRTPLYMRGLWEDNQSRLWLGYQGEGGFGDPRIHTNLV